jgi:hypothetical protein
LQDFLLQAVDEGDDCATTGFVEQSVDDQHSGHGGQAKQKDGAQPPLQLWHLAAEEMRNRANSIPNPDNLALPLTSGRCPAPVDDERMPPPRRLPLPEWIEILGFCCCWSTPFIVAGWEGKAQLLGWLSAAKSYQLTMLADSG